MKEKICVICGAKLKNDGHNPNGFLSNVYNNDIHDNIVAIKFDSEIRLATRIVIKNMPFYDVDFKPGDKCCDECYKTVLMSGLIRNYNNMSRQQVLTRLAKIQGV